MFLKLPFKSCHSGYSVIPVASNSISIYHVFSCSYCKTKDAHCAQHDHPEFLNLNIPSYQCSAYGANVKFKVLSNKMCDVYSCFAQCRITGQSTPVSSHADQFLPRGTETSANAFSSPWSSCDLGLSSASIHLAPQLLSPLKLHGIIQLKPTLSNQHSQCRAIVTLPD